ncbi:MAG: hypothetical protein QNJ12_15085 [Ilumatobacter sp.]|uniref:hypothetical protein n=1 Tax=Ilumatobacter sp. TaxID=1967498 RepID=UPI002604C6B2|nr:hypothetical protein [Ilumatobacter sp.]MDJ0770124.1 hypothetical protein [Ilumatobacter sp.]
MTGTVVGEVLDVVDVLEVLDVLGVLDVVVDVELGAVEAATASVLGGTLGIGAGVVVPAASDTGTVSADVVLGAAASSSPSWPLTSTQTITPTRNTNTTPITAGMLTFQRSPDAGTPG